MRAQEAAEMIVQHLADIKGLIIACFACLGALIAGVAILIGRR